MLTESDILNQVEKSRNGTDKRLDALVALQTRTNDLLEQLVGLSGGTTEPPDEKK
ncbi:MAG: hypothetical protein M3Y91_02220 [Actinomycetota bacterium]|nr:hypothetical protein [Actinomycetota bacterium]